METRILTDTQTTGDVFTMSAGLVAIHMGHHAGGEWILQARYIDGTWTETDVSFDDVGIQFFHAVPTKKYRLHGGTVGGDATATNVFLG